MCIVAGADECNDSLIARVSAHVSIISFGPYPLGGHVGPHVAGLFLEFIQSRSGRVGCAQATYTYRDTEAFQDSVGRCILEACKVCPEGTSII